MKKGKLQTKLLGLIGFCICMICMEHLFVMPVNADEERELVRIGYVLGEGYQEGKAEEYKSGYGYEYYPKLSYYANWEYEYVYGSFNELMEQLEAGEIDIMGNLYYTEDRAEKIYYSTEEQGRDNCYIYVPAKCPIISSSDYSTLE